MTARSFPKHLSGIYSLENPLSRMHARILIPILFLIPVYSMAQLPMQDQVFMEDGRELDGLIIEQKPGVHLRLWRPDEGDTLVLHMEQIDRILRIPAPMISQTDPEKMSEEIKEVNYGTNRFATLIRGAHGGFTYGFHGAGIAVGFRMHPGIEIGIGAQYFGEYTNKAFRQIMPLCLESRFRLHRSKSGRFERLFSLETGINFSLNKYFWNHERGEFLSITNGYYLHPALGFKIYLFPNLGLILDLGYQLNTGHLHTYDTKERLGYKRYHNAILRGSFFF
jgi:hypothetical protein